MTEKKRKIIQITAATSGHKNEMYPQLYALCDDGTLWARIFDWNSVAKWSRIEPIPQ